MVPVGDSIERSTSPFGDMKSSIELTFGELSVKSGFDASFAQSLFLCVALYGFGPDVRGVEEFVLF